MAGSRKYLIVNADDFGFSKGITDGILEAHANGIVTSTSLMVRTRWSRYAAHRVREFPKLSVGLHCQFLPKVGYKSHDYLQQLKRQLKKFELLMGKLPSHLDLHGVPPATPEMKLALYSFIQNCQAPYRGKDRLILDFYGLKKGQPSMENITTDFLSSLLVFVKPGVTILVCHPGRSSTRFHDPYNVQRKEELATLTSPIIFARLKELGINLINSQEEELL